eukprot:1022238-Alexandrium_andersonii.AAC.1
MEVPRTVSIQQLDARDHLGRMLALSREGVRQARKAILNNQEVPITVDPLHPVFLGGHKVTCQVRPHVGGLIDV